MAQTPRRGGRAARLAVVACFTLNLLSGCVADALILGWNRETLEPNGVERRMVASDVGPVECWVARSPGARHREPEAFVLFFVGKLDRAERWTPAVAGAWGDRPVEVWG